jgi:hypothetical protein
MELPPPIRLAAAAKLFLARFFFSFLFPHKFS